MATKAVTTKMTTGQLVIEYVHFKRDKKNLEDLLRFGKSKVVVKESESEDDKVLLINGQKNPKTKECLTVEIKPGDVLAKYPDGYHVFSEGGFIESHKDL